MFGKYPIITNMHENELEAIQQKRSETFFLCEVYLFKICKNICIKWTYFEDTDKGFQIVSASFPSPLTYLSEFILDKSNPIPGVANSWSCIVQVLKWNRSLPSLIKQMSRRWETHSSFVFFVDIRYLLVRKTQNIQKWSLFCMLANRSNDHGNTLSGWKSVLRQKSDAR